MVIPDIVVVGASAGGVEALSALFWDIPSSVPNAFFVALHVSNRRSCLPSILERTGRVPVEHPRDGQKINFGRIYVAPPDFHLLVGNGIMHLGQGPKERHVRPAIDPLFRSAAQVYGQRVIGVLLSGMLDDGVEGLKEIKRHGGLAVVQAPTEARFPYMPQHALDKIEIDYCLPVAQIRDLITRLPELPRLPMGKETRSSSHSVWHNP
jgi:two-component system, chemotaxis family, protein-glutamate methylesterase/glutaminase